MIRLIQRMALVAVALIAGGNAFAYDFKVGDVYYNILSKAGRRVEVTSDGSAYSYMGDVTIPDKVAYEGVTYAVTSIGKSAFYENAYLTSVTIPSSVTSIGVSAFLGCAALKEVHISDLSAWCGINFVHRESTPLYNSEANLYLNGELLVDVVIPDDVTEVKDCTFLGCRSMTSVTIPSSVTSIGESAFSMCTGLKDVTILEGVASIGNYAFSTCTDLTSVTIPSSVTSIGEGAFYNCTALTSVTIPESVTSIGESAFQDSGLISVTIPSSVTSIGVYAFWYCTDLRVAMIGEHVESIENAVFYGCDNLEEVYSKALNPPALSRIYWTEEDFFNAETYKNAILYVPSASMEAYKADSEWGRFSNIRGMETSGVAKLDKDKVTVTAQDGRIVVDGADGAMVEVYDLNGRIVYNGTNEEMPSFAAGFYIVKVAGQSFKVVL